MSRHYSKEHATRSKGTQDSLKYPAQPQELSAVPPQLTSELLHCLSTFFFSSGTAGRSRSKARSLHEKKLLLRKLLHGHRWSHAAWQIIKTRTQTTKSTRQDADPPARFASYHQEDSKANSERGKSPTETTTKDLPRHSGKKPTVSHKLKNLQQTN